MGLFQRATAEDNTQISAHLFGAWCRQLAAGNRTRQQLITKFALSGDDVTQLDALIASYQAMPSNNAAATLLKVLRQQAMEDVFLMIQAGDYTEAEARAALGF
jgi:hypothetical protein